MNIYGSEKMNYSIRDIARIAGVSIGTVSRVLNKADNVDEAIRARTLETIRRTGYQHASRGRRTGSVSTPAAGRKTRTIALLSPGMSSEWKTHELWAGYLSGIEQTCRERRYQLLIYMADAAEKEEDLLKDVLRRCDGILLKLERKFPEYVRKLIVGLPAAGFGAIPSREALPQVVLNNSLAGKALTEKLIGLGHRRIAFLNHVPGNSGFAERSGGYLETMKEHGLFDPALLLTTDSGNASADSLKPEALPPRFPEEVRHLAALPDPPSAVIAANDWAALGLLHTCADEGIAVPDTFSVAGIYDAGPWTSFCVPPLATVAMPFGESARCAAAILCDRIEGVGTYPDNAPSVVYLPGKVILRESVQPFRRKGVAK